MVKSVATGILKEHLNEDMLFNKDGYTTEAIHYDESGIKIITTKKSYMQNGTIVEQQQFRDKRADSTITRNIRNAQGNIVKTVTENDKGKKITEIISYSYNEKGALAEMKMKESRFVYDYDSLGRVITRKFYEPADTLINTFRYFYDSRGNIAKCDRMNPDGSLNTRLLFTFDEKGNVLQQKTYEAVGKTEKTTTYTYRYDGHDNWTRKTIMVHGERKGFIVERTLEYYP